MVKRAFLMVALASLHAATGHAAAVIHLPIPRRRRPAFPSCPAPRSRSCCAARVAPLRTSIPIPHVAGHCAEIANGSCLRHEDKLYLEELDLPATASVDVTAWAKSLAPLASASRGTLMTLFLAGMQGWFPWFYAREVPREGTPSMTKNPGP